MKQILRLGENRLVGKDVRVFSSRAVSDLGLHWHSYCELIYFYDGILESTVNGRKVQLHGGTVYMMSPLDLHHTVVKDKNAPIRFTNVSFNENIADKNILPKLNCPYYIEHSSEKVRTLFDLISNSDDDREKHHLLNAILCNIVNDKYRLDNLNDKTIINEKVISCIKYISENFNTQISLTSAASYLHLAPAYLSNLFSKSCGCTFKDYLTGYRLSYAKNLLKNQDFTISEICYMCGFTTLSHFFRCFKSNTGFTPSEYRNSL